MPIRSVESNPETLTLTAIGEYPVTVERLWAAWTDPRQLERFWGPPEWPATFTRHEVRKGGRSDYYMTGPSGERSYGYWLCEFVEDNKSFSVRDGFAKPDGTPNTELPEGGITVSFEATATGSRFVAVSTFASIEAMEKLLAMGMVEGLTAALGQMDAVLG